MPKYTVWIIEQPRELTRTTGRKREANVRHEASAHLTPADAAFDLLDDVALCSPDYSPPQDPTGRYVVAVRDIDSLALMLVVATISNVDGDRHVVNIASVEPCDPTSLPYLDQPWRWSLGSGSRLEVYCDDGSETGLTLWIEDRAGVAMLMMKPDDGDGVPMLPGLALSLAACRRLCIGVAAGSQRGVLGLPSSPRREQAEVDALIADWTRDPCYDLEDADGFDAHRDELLAVRKAHEAEWDAKRREAKRPRLALRAKHPDLWQRAMLAAVSAGQDADDAFATADAVLARLEADQALFEPPPDYLRTIDPAMTKAALLVLASGCAERLTTVPDDRRGVGRSHVIAQVVAWVESQWPDSEPGSEGLAKIMQAVRRGTAGVADR